MTNEKCGWPRCRSTNIDVIWLGVPLCQKHYGLIDSSNPVETKALSSYTLDEAKRILKVK